MSSSPTYAPSPSPAAVVEPPEVIVVDSHRVWCDGSGGALGHPRVYMEMGAAGFVECGYCDRRFVAASHHGHDEAEALAPAAYEGPETSTN